MDAIYSRKFNCAQIVATYKCKYCDFMADVWIILNHHIWRCHRSFHDYSKIDSKIKPYTCEDCTFTSYSILVWLAHTYICKEQNKVISAGKTSEENLMITSFYIDSEKYFCCKLCEYKSDRGHDFQIHLLRHNTIQPYSKCNQCPYKTNSVYNLHIHVKIRHETAALVYHECKQCPYKTPFKQTLRNHMIARHTDPKEITWFECEQCDHKTKTKKALKRHFTIRHAREKMSCLKCTHCSFQTVFKRSLRDHVIAYHTDPKEIKWFECDHCPHKSKQKSNLQKHINSKHARENLVYHECSQCWFGSPYKRALKQHMMRFHTDSKEMRLQSKNKES